MLTKTFSIIFVLLCTLSLQGCWEQAGVVVHEPGEYKGAADSLKVDQAALQKRFSSQADR